MTKLPRVTGNQLIKYLINKKGFRNTHQKGSHVSLRHDVENKFTSIPAKNEVLGPGLSMQILNDCGISREEFTLDYQHGLIK